MRRLSSPLAALFLLLATCAAPPSGEDAGAWERLDLWVTAPRVEIGAGGGRPWARRIAYLGPAEVRDRNLVAPSHFRRIKRLAASEVRALEQVAGSRLAWPVELGAEPYLAFAPLRDETRDRAVTYRVGVRTGDGRLHELLRQEAEQRVPPGPATVHVDLGAFAGSSVELLLQVDPPAGAAAGGGIRALWASPAVYSRKDGVAERTAASTERPNVLLIGADTLRADALGAYGAQPSVTPGLDRLAAESDVWLDAVSCFNVTNPSFLSLMTGLYGKSHGVYDLRTPLPPARETLAERFSAAGYDTLAVISARHLGDHASGIGQGFDEVALTGRHFTAQIAADMTMDWIAERQAPFFAWVHMFDPHTPHTPPAPYAWGFAPPAAEGLRPVTEWRPFRQPGPLPFINKVLAGHHGLYAGEVAYLDRHVDRLLDFLRSRGLLENTVVVFVADHGENLEDHGVRYGHHGLWETTTRVPLMIRWPGAERTGRRLEGLVQNVDIAPTLLAVAGLEPLPVDGEDLRQLTGEGRRGRRVAFSEHSHQTGARVRTDRWAYMKSHGNPFFTDGAYLFDLQQDPDELVNLAGTGLDIEAELERVLGAWLAERDDDEAPRPANLSEEDVERLRALGYL